MLRELNEAARALVAARVVLFDWHATLVDNGASVNLFDAAV